MSCRKSTGPPQKGSSRACWTGSRRAIPPRFHEVLSKVSRPGFRRMTRRTADRHQHTGTSMTHFSTISLATASMQLPVQDTNVPVSADTSSAGDWRELASLMLHELARAPRATWAFTEQIQPKADEEVPDLPTAEEPVSSETEASNEAEAADDSDAAEVDRSEEHTSELQSQSNLVFRLFFKGYGDHRDLPSFPTRRSSDLKPKTLFRRRRKPPMRPKLPMTAMRPKSMQCSRTSKASSMELRHTPHPCQILGRRARSPTACVRRFC